MNRANAKRDQFELFLRNHPLTRRTFDGVAWEYVACGTGAPLLLLPGALATAHTSFQYTLAFEDRYRVIAPTYPAAITRVAPLVDGLAALIRAEGGSAAHVVGGSYSGLIAQCLVRRHPDLVASLVLTNTGVPRSQRARATTILLAGLAILSEQHLRRVLKRCIRSFLPAATPSQDFWRGYFAQLIDTLRRDDYLSRLKVAIDFDASYRFAADDLAQWGRPILIVEATADAIFRDKERAALRRLYPQAVAHVQNAHTHSASLDEADATIALMRPFFAENEPAENDNALAPVAHRPRRIGIIALGSRGDVQPFIALAQQLHARGHQVRVLAITDYADLIRSYGLDYAPLVGSAAELMDRDLVYSVLEGVANPALVAFRFLQAVDPIITKLMADCYAGCHDADALVVSSLGQYVAESIVERCGMPMVLAHFHPNSATRCWPSMDFPTLPSAVPGRELYNLATHWLAEHGRWQLLRWALNRGRRSVLGLPPQRPLALERRVRTTHRPVIYGYSAHVAPPPPDWNTDAHVTGYWFTDHGADWQPPGKLVAFIAAGPPPIYIGFGSTLVGRNPDSMTQLIVNALEQTGQRAILFRGWGDMGNGALPPNVLLIDAVPHDWLFPRVAAAVHHGGAGTTAAAVRAGIPSVVVPAFGDMFFWGAQVAALGVGPPPIPRAQLNADRLAAAIVAATSDPAMTARAAALGQRLVAEAGAERAAFLVEQFIKGA